MRHRLAKYLRFDEIIFVAVGTAGLAYCAYAKLQERAAVYAASQLVMLQVDHQAPVPSKNAVMGTVSIPALQLSAPITNGIESIALVRGVGHIPGTAMPGGLGTMGLAGHRDTFFRSLHRVKQGMEIRVSDEDGTFHYTIDATEIVTPDQVRVLDIGSRPELVLITCYPFDFIGAAPRRFIVHAHLLSVVSDQDQVPSTE